MASQQPSKIEAMLAYRRLKPAIPMSRRNPLLRCLFLALSLCTLPLIATARQTHTVDAPQAVDGPLTAAKAPAMDNDSIMKMAKAGLGDDLIIETINTQPGQYLTDADSLVKLKTANVSDRVITAMINKGRRQLTNVPEKPVEISDVNEIGVYYKDHTGKWIEIEPEIVHIKSGGFIKSTVTHGIIKEDRNGHVNGRESKLLLPRPVEFLIYTPDGVDAGEYSLVKFRLNSDSREFRIFTGGIIHSSDAGARDEVPFKAVRTAPHTYQFTLGPDTYGAEYGI